LGGLARIFPEVSWLRSQGPGRKARVILWRGSLKHGRCGQIGSAPRVEAAKIFSPSIGYKPGSGKST